MISRKIVYKGKFNKTAAEAFFDVLRKVEITGEVRLVSENQVDIDVDGDPSMIKLAMHQMERDPRIKALIHQRDVTPMDYRYFEGVNLLA